MRPKYKVYGFRLLVSSLVGLLNGLLGVDPSLGILTFILAYFLVTPISLRMWREDLRGMGLMDLYKEAIGASLLTLILVWSLTMSFTGHGVAVYTVRARGSGVHQIETLDGRILLPGNEELHGYNVILLNFSDGELKNAKLGVCLERNLSSSLKMGSYNITLKNDKLSVSVKLNPYEEGARDVLRKIFGNLTVYRNGTVMLGNISLSPGTVGELKLGKSNVFIRYEGHYLTLELKSDLAIGGQESPMSSLISEVREEGSKLCVFDAKEPKFGRRSINVGDRFYVVITGEG